MSKTSKHDRPRRISRPQKPGSAQKLDAPALTKLLDEWMLGDEIDQRETLNGLRRPVDEDRPES